MATEQLITEEPIVRPRMPELDVIRGIAILAVLMFHGLAGVAWTHVARPAWQQAILAVALQGWAGVNLFFVHRRWVNIRCLAFYGYISYGLYLVYGLDYGWCDSLIRKLIPSINPEANFYEACFRLVVSVATATALAYVSRVTYEEFFLRLKDGSGKSRRQSSTVVAA